MTFYVPIVSLGSQGSVHHGVYLGSCPAHTAPDPYGTPADSGSTGRWSHVPFLGCARPPGTCPTCNLPRPGSSMLSPHNSILGRVNCSLDVVPIGVFLIALSGLWPRTNLLWETLPRGQKDPDNITHGISGTHQIGSQRGQIDEYHYVNHDSFYNWGTDVRWDCCSTVLIHTSSPKPAITSVIKKERWVNMQHEQSHVNGPMKKTKKFSSPFTEPANQHSQ